MPYTPGILNPYTDEPLPAPHIASCQVHALTGTVFCKDTVSHSSRTGMILIVVAVLALALVFSFTVQLTIGTSSMTPTVLTMASATAGTISPILWPIIGIAIGTILGVIARGRH